MPHDEISVERAGILLTTTSFEDTVHIYEAFLGRQPESEEVTTKWSEVDIIEFLACVAYSDEFNLLTSKGLGGETASSNILMDPMPPHLIHWAEERFALHGHFRKIAPTEPRVAILITLLKSARVAAKLVSVGGIARANLLVSSLQDLAHQAVATPPGTSGQSVHNLYLLLLGRTPETALAAAPQPTRSPRQTLNHFFYSSEFGNRLAAIRTHSVRLTASPLSRNLRSWLEDVFEVPLTPDAGAAAAIAALLRTVETEVESTAPLSSGDLIAEAAEMLEAISARDIGDAAGALPFDELVRGSGLFDPEWYFASYNDVVKTRAAALEHFVHGGANSGHDPNPDFDTAFYCATHPESKSFPGPPFEHYLRIGRLAGYRTKPPSLYARWVDRFDGLAPEHLAWIDEDAVRSRLPWPVRIHISCDGETDLAEAQVGRPPVRHILGFDSGPPQDPLIDSIAADTILVLSLEPARLRPHACYCFTPRSHQWGGCGI